MSDYKLQFDEHGYGGIRGPSLEAVTARVAKTIAEDFDGKTRAALIELGWVPPDQASADRSKLESCIREMQQSIPGGRTADPQEIADTLRAIALRYGVTMGDEA